MKPPLPARIALVLVVVAVVALLILRGRGRDGEALEASGTVEATEAILGFEIAGRVAAVAVREGDRVTAGQVVAALDSTEAAARLAQAAAALEAARALRAELERGSRPEEIALARAEAAAAAERRTDARRDYDRAVLLHDGGAVSVEVRDKARTALEVAENQARAADERRRLVEEGPRAERIAAQRAETARAEAAWRAASAALDRTRAVAPFDGIVTARHREPGEVVGPGSPAITVLDPADRWVRIYVPETRIGRVRIGAPAAIASDSRPGRRYAGEVTHIASEAEFTPRNVQTTEERVRLVYAVKVRVLGDDALELKPGMPADVVLEPGAGS